jgi:transcriptional regulator with XRE-family HTH domain
MDEKQIAKNVKKVRLDNNLSQERLAELSGLTKGYISKIEKSDKAPPLSTLSRIADALNVDVGVLTAEDLDLPFNIKMCITRKGEGKKLSSGSLEGYHYEALAHEKSGKNMIPFIIQPGFHEKAVFSHEGEEFMFTIQGIHEFVYDGQKYTLHEGDSVYFDSVIPHTGRSVGEQKAMVLAVMYSYKRHRPEDSPESRIKIDRHQKD